jgi:hypothetical protein
VFSAISYATEDWLFIFLLLIGWLVVNEEESGGEGGAGDLTRALLETPGPQPTAYRGFSFCFFLFMRK